MAGDLPPGVPGRGRTAGPGGAGVRRDLRGEAGRPPARSRRKTLTATRSGASPSHPAEDPQPDRRHAEDSRRLRHWSNVKVVNRQCVFQSGRVEVDPADEERGPRCDRRGEGDRAGQGCLVRWVVPVQGRFPRAVRRAAEVERIRVGPGTGGQAGGIGAGGEVEPVRGVPVAPPPLLPGVADRHAGQRCSGVVLETRTERRDQGETTQGPERAVP